MDYITFIIKNQATTAGPIISDLFFFKYLDRDLAVVYTNGNWFVILMSRAYFGDWVIEIHCYSPLNDILAHNSEHILSAYILKEDGKRGELEITRNFGAKYFKDVKKFEIILYGNNPCSRV